VQFFLTILSVDAVAWVMNIPRCNLPHRKLQSPQLSPVKAA